MEGGRWGLVIILSAFCIQVLAFGITNAIGVYNVAFLRYFDNDSVGVSLITSINLAVFLGSGPLASFLMARMSYRKIALLGSVMTVLGIFLMPFLPYIPALCICFGVLTGVGQCLVYVPSHVLTGLYYRRHQSLATGFATSGSGLGGTIMPIIIGKLIDHYGWKGSLIFMAGLELHLIVFAALLRSPPKERDIHKKEKEAISLLEQNGCDGTIRTSEKKSGDHAVPECRYRSSSAKSEDSAELMSREQMNMIGVGSIAPPAKIVDHVQVDQLESAVGDHEASNVDLVSVEKAKTTDTEQQDIPGCSISEIENTVTSQSAQALSTNHNSDSNGVSPESKGDVKVLRHIYLFTDVGFCVYFLSSVFWNAAAAVVLAFAPDMTIENGSCSDLDAAWLSTSFGFGTFIGCMVGGILGNIWLYRRRMLYIMANILCGVFFAACPFGSTFAEFAVMLVLGGLAFGVILGLLIVVLIDIIGDENLSDGMGYIMLANGLGAFMGPSLAGVIRKASGSYDLAFYIGGVLSLLAGVSMWLIPLIRWTLPSSRKNKRMGINTGLKITV